MKHIYKKLKAVAFGRYGEHISANYLRLKGYKIVGQNVRTHFGEIDIIATRAKTLCFIEVKSRPDLEQALYALSRHQQKRILNAALTFYSSHACYVDFDIRFDLMAVTPFRVPFHLENAWGEE